MWEEKTWMVIDTPSRALLAFTGPPTLRRRPEETAMSDNVYDRLIDNLVLIGGAVPILKCDEFTALMKELFSPEEADLAASMPLGTKSLDAIGTHVGRPVEEILPLLESMADKGLVFHQMRNATRHYKLMAVLPGFFEFQFMKGGTTEKDYTLARLFRNYFDKAETLTAGADLELLRKITPFSRVIPVEEEIAGGNEVQPYEVVSEYIRKAEHISVSTCYCRHFGELLEEPCDKPKENCMAFGPNARFAEERGYGRLVSQEEALRILDEAEEAGLVHMTSNTTKYIDFICNCCPCHCGIVKSFLRMDMPSIGAVSNFRLKVDEEACIGCGDCVERCPMGALAVEDERLRVDPARCIGCGLCNSVCPSEALSMERLEAAPTPPWDHKALDAAIMESIQKAVKAAG
jgi:ferredoxin